MFYDLLNDLALDARLQPGAVGEVDLALQHSPQLQSDDLLLCDRGFTGFVLAKHVSNALRGSLLNFV